MLNPMTNLVILFVFQVFPEHGDALAASASRPVDIRENLFWQGVFGRIH